MKLEIKSFLYFFHTCFKIKLSCNLVYDFGFMTIRSSQRVINALQFVWVMLVMEMFPFSRRITKYIVFHISSWSFVYDCIFMNSRSSSRFINVLLILVRVLLRILEICCVWNIHFTIYLQSNVNALFLELLHEFRNVDVTFSFVVACKRGCFRWLNPDNIYRNSFEYEKDNENNKVFGIKIRSPGIYRIYAQVGINGPEQGWGSTKI